MKGRRPQPAGVKSQKAAVRSTRSAAVAAVASGAVQRPTWLKGEGRKIWDRLAPQLAKAKLLTAIDAETFARYCRNFARWRSLQILLDREGEIYETETYAGGGEGAAATGRVMKRAHAALLVADRLERMMLATEDRFGLNPSHRQQIFAQRAQTGQSGDLFGDATPVSPAAPAKPAEPSTPVPDSPVGMLN